MRITCPECGFARQVPDDKVPAASVFATCPKCKSRFKFRELDARPVYDVHADAPEAEVESSESAETAGAAVLHSESEQAQDAMIGEDRSERRPPESAPDEEAGISPEAPGVQESLDASEPQATDAGNAPQDDMGEDDMAGRYSPPPFATWVPDEEGADAPQAPRATPEAGAESSGGDQDDPGLEDIPENGVVTPQSSMRPEQPEYPEAPETAEEGEGAGSPEADAASPPDQEETRIFQAGEADGDDEEQAPPPGQEKDGVRDIWARLQAMDAMDDDGAPTSGTSPRSAGQDFTGGDSGADGEGEAFDGGEPPWERQERFGFFTGLVLTLKKILFQPVDFFESLAPGRGVVKSMVFYLVILEFMLLVDFLWIFIGIQTNVLDQSQLGNLNLPDFSGPGFLISLILTPVIFAGGVCLFSLVLHGLLTVFQCAARGVGDTLRVVFYGAAPMILYAVPVTRLIMLPVIVIWIIALQAIGLKKVQGGPYANTLAAIFIVWSICMFAFGALLKVALPGFAA